jgi:threonylcarbamoyladenosine tRNA methylthiotransferase CDKAL1
MTREGQRVFVRTFGCSSNTADAEIMRGCLVQAGFKLVENAEDADALVFNTCVVKSPTENRIVEELREAAKLEKKLIVAGCLPLISLERLRSQVKFDGVLSPSSTGRIVEAVQSVLRGEKIQWLKGDAETKPLLELPRQATNPVVSIVPVAQGCLGSCSYCCVVFARGRLRSHTINDVVERVRSDLQSGAMEVWLTGQDMACYGRDIGTNLVDLLKAVCSIKEDEFFIRVGMMTPNYILDMLDRLVEAFLDEHVFKFLHLPVQSGDDEVLKRMNRFYSVEDFREIVASFRQAIPNITVATDVICGFPGESEEAFQRSLKLIEEVQPDVVNVSKFFPRPHTLAEKMSPKVSASEVKRRSQNMAKLIKNVSAAKNSAWKDWTGKILIDEKGKQPGSWIGRNFAYKPVVIRSENNPLLGESMNVHVVKTFQTYLEAEPL